MAACTGLNTDNAPLGPEKWNHELDHSYLCRFWWAVNPIAQKWFNLINTYNSQTYAWAYDEFDVPKGDAMDNLKAILNNPQKFEKIPNSET